MELIKFYYCNRPTKSRSKDNANIADVCTITSIYHGIIFIPHNCIWNIEEFGSLFLGHKSTKIK